MKIKKQMYPKTLRAGSEKYFVTEKLDGSNIGFAKVDGKLLIFTRRQILTTDEHMEYPGLRGFLDTYENELLDFLSEKSVIFGEWLGQGRIKYDIDKSDLKNRFYMFAFANLHDDFLTGDKYRNFKYVHEYYGDEQPEWLNYVPFLGDAENLTDAKKLYNPISKLDGKSVSEGVVIVNGNTPLKMVMHKQR